MQPEKLAEIRTLIEADPAVAQAVRVLTMHFGPQEVLLNLDIRFRDELSVAEISDAVDRIERTVRDHHPDVKRIFIEMDSLRSKRHRAHVDFQSSLAPMPEPEG